MLGPNPLMAHLEITKGEPRGTRFPLTEAVNVLGRASVSTVPVRDKAASRAHAEIRRDGPFLTLVDLGSANGTKVNDRRVKERLLEYGDRVRIGAVEMTLVADPQDKPLADLIPGHVLKERIGEGGMGVVFRAEQRSLGRSVAVKLLPPQRAKDRVVVEQFVAEARAAGGLTHPNLIQVHDVVSEGDLHYFTMELVDGPTAGQLVKNLGPLLPGEALSIAQQAAKALAYVHDSGLVHRDVKPDNLIIAPGSVVKLADLGIAKTIQDLDQENSESGNGMIVGTPFYLAPEIALGERCDHRADLYSFGATLFHLLAGRPPFRGGNVSEIIRGHCYDPPPDVREFNAEVDAATAQLVSQLMAKRADDRPATAKEVERQLVQRMARADPPTTIISRYQNRPKSQPPATGGKTVETVAIPPRAPAKRRSATRKLGFVFLLLVLAAGAAWYFLDLSQYLR